MKNCCGDEQAPKKPAGVDVFDPVASGSCCATSATSGEDETDRDRTTSCCSS